MHQCCPEGSENHQFVDHLSVHNFTMKNTSVLLRTRWCLIPWNADPRIHWRIDTRKLLLFFNYSEMWLKDLYGKTSCSQAWRLSLSTLWLYEAKRFSIRSPHHLDLAAGNRKGGSGAACRAFWFEDLRKTYMVLSLGCKKYRKIRDMEKRSMTWSSIASAAKIHSDWGSATCNFLVDYIIYLYIYIISYHSTTLL